MEPITFLEELLVQMVDNRASDLHLVSGMSPIIRVDSDLLPLNNQPELTNSDIVAILKIILPANKVALLDTTTEIDFSFDRPALDSRFRANSFLQTFGHSIAIRRISKKVPTLDDLNLPDVLTKLCNLEHGLILVTGPTGSGKSTTLAAMIDYLNTNFAKHIITIEDPIEYLHYHKRALIQQREVDQHTASFDLALRAALREDPDYLLVGEMRDLETMRLALTAAETGHLVLATLHTNTAVESVERIINVFPAAEKSLIRSILANTLQAVISQRLLKRKLRGRIAAQEIMICTPAVRNLTREDKTHQLYSAIQMGKGIGMRTMAYSIRQLIDKNLIDRDKYIHLASD